MKKKTFDFHWFEELPKKKQNKIIQAHVACVAEKLKAQIGKYKKTKWKANINQNISFTLFFCFFIFRRVLSLLGAVWGFHIRHASNHQNHNK